MEIKRGDTVFFEGREYVIQSIQVTEDHVGRSVSFVARDPFLAQDYIEAERARQNQRQHVEAMKTMLPKLEKALDE